jgi:hypothetical protein
VFDKLLLRIRISQREIAIIDEIMRIRTERKRVFSALSKALSRKTAECLHLSSQVDAEKRSAADACTAKDREIESLRTLRKDIDEETKEALKRRQSLEIAQVKAKYEDQLRKLAHTLKVTCPVLNFAISSY